MNHTPRKEAHHERNRRTDRVCLGDRVGIVGSCTLDDDDILKELMEMHPLYARLAEMWFIQENQRELTEEEWSDFKHCLTAHTNKCMKLARLYNLSYVAYASDDTEWLHEVSKKIDEIKTELFDYC